MKYFLAIILSAFFSQSAMANGPFSVFVGESQSVVLDSYSYVEVSRKGFCEVSYDQKKRIWQITGLKPGFVIVSFFDQKESTTSSHKIYVEIKKKEPPPHVAPEILSLCQKKGISCEDHGRFVSGQTDDFFWFVYARDICQQKNCFFSVTLSSSGQEKGLLYLKKEVPDEVSVHIAPSGTIHLSRHCTQEDDYEKKSSWRIFQTEIPITCMKKNQKMMQIYGKILLMSSLTAKELGLDTMIEGDLRIQGPSHIDLISAIRASIQDEKIKVIAEPNIRLFPGQKATLHSGGEFAFREEKDDKNVVSWKENGMKIDATIWPTDQQNKVFLDYDFSLKTKEKKDSSSLNSHQLASRVLMTSGVPQIVGGAQFEHQKDGENSLPLRQIPIIGPVFKTYSGQVSQFQIYLSLEVRQVTESTETTVSLPSYKITPISQ